MIGNLNFFEKGHTVNANVPTGEVVHAVVAVDLVDAMVAEEAVDSAAVEIETAISEITALRIGSPESDYVNRDGT